MRCPECQSEKTPAVLETRQIQDVTSIRRRRACADCGYRFTTYEIPIDRFRESLERQIDPEPIMREIYRAVLESLVGATQARLQEEPACVKTPLD